MKFAEFRNQMCTVFSFKERLSAFLGATLFTLLTFLPFYIIVIEFIVVYIFLWIELAILLIFLTMLMVDVWFHLFKKALYLRKGDSISMETLNRYALVLMLIINAFVLVLGIIIITVIVPNLFI